MSFAFGANQVRRVEGDKANLPYSGANSPVVYMSGDPA